MTGLGFEDKAGTEQVTRLALASRLAADECHRLEQKKMHKTHLGTGRSFGKDRLQTSQNARRRLRGNQIRRRRGESEHGVLILMVSEDEKEADGRSCV